MFKNNFKKAKQNTKNIFENYKKQREAFDSLMASSEGDGVDIEYLENRLKALDEQSFSVAVAGEVKAGKSTFINALLGEEVLPTDVLQATSSIVEVYKAKQSCLTVTFADGNKKEILDDLTTPDIDEAQEELKKICSLSNDNRDIPVTYLDMLISKSEGPLEASDDFIADLESATNSENLLEKKEEIQNYLSQRKKGDIPARIEFGSSKIRDFGDLRIVDTPGVNAIGGVQNATIEYLQNVSFEYLENANAILFVQPIKPIESQSLRAFVKGTISDRSKQSLFLLLTHTSNCTRDEVERLREEAVRLYKNDIDEKHIFVLDNLLQQLHDDLLNKKAEEQIERESEAKIELLDKWKGRARRANKTIIQQLKADAGFEPMIEAMEKLSHDKGFIQLEEILKKIEVGYQRQDKRLSAKLEFAEREKVAPHEFDKKIKKIVDDLEIYQSQLNVVLEEVHQRFKGQSSSVVMKLREIKEKYLKKNSEEVSNLQEMRKVAQDAQNELEDYISEYSKEVKEFYEVEQNRLSADFEHQHKFVVPVIDVDKVEKQAWEKSWSISYVKQDEGYGGEVGGLVGLVGGVVGGAFLGPIGYVAAPIAAAVVGAGIGSLFNDVPAQQWYEGEKKKKEKLGQIDHLRDQNPDEFKRKFIALYGEEKFAKTFVHHPSHAKALQHVKNDFEEWLQKAVRELDEQCGQFIDQFDDVLRAEVARNVDERKRALEDQKSKKLSNDGLIVQIQQLTELRHTIEKSRRIASTLLGDLK